MPWTICNVGQDSRYQEAVDTYGAAIERLVRGYEADPDKRADLLQEIHIELWRSFEIFEDRCSLRTWVYRIAHHSAATHVMKQRRMRSAGLVSIEDMESLPSPKDHEQSAADQLALERLLTLIHRLRPLDRELMLLYLEGMDAGAIGEITGISPGNVRNKIYRIKTVLAQQFHGGSAP